MCIRDSNIHYVNDCLESVGARGSRAKYNIVHSTYFAVTFMVESYGTFIYLWTDADSLGSGENIFSYVVATNAKVFAASLSIFLELISHEFL